MFVRKEVLSDMISEDRGSYPCDGCMGIGNMSVCGYFVSAGCCPYFDLSDDSFSDTDGTADDIDDIPFQTVATGVTPDTLLADFGRGNCAEPAEHVTPPSGGAGGERLLGCLAAVTPDTPITPQRGG